MSPRTPIVAVAVAFVLLLVGLVVGFLPVSSGSASCGSALMEAEWAVGCKSALRSTRTLSLALMGGAGLACVFAAGALAALRDRRRRLA
jgi:hypothetical protein